MGTLQPGFPSPSMLPEYWSLIITDLKDCFLNIPLTSQDFEQFAFTVPSLNNVTPAACYHEKVLTRGMLNSPTICQYFVVCMLQPVRDRLPQCFSFLVIHYMDDILCTAPKRAVLTSCFSVIQQAISEAQKKIQLAVSIAPEKNSNFLSFSIFGHAVRRQGD